MNLDAEAVARVLADRRKRFFDEMDRDPSLAAYVRGIAASENGGHPAGIMERLLNGADMNGRKSLRDEINSGFYGPVNRGTVQGLPASPAYDAAFQRVRAGSNDIGLLTDQGMRNEHKPAAAIGVAPTLINGEYYSPMGRKGLDWKTSIERAAMAGAGGSMNGGYGVDPTGTAGISGPVHTNTPQGPDPRFIDQQPVAPSPAAPTPQGGGQTAIGALDFNTPGLAGAVQDFGNALGQYMKAMTPRPPQVQIAQAQKPRVSFASVAELLANRAKAGIHKSNRGLA